MSGKEDEHLTRLLQEAGSGNAKAADELLPLVYESLKQMALQRMASERRDHTLQATALVNECYLRMFGASSMRFEARAAFFHAASEAMRRILVEHARSRGRVKRGGKGRRIPMNVLDLADEPEPRDILDLDDALTRLEKESPSTAAVVKLRFYGGLAVQEVADTLGISARTVNREWNYARAWLFSALEDGVSQ